MMEFISTADAPAALGHYSQAIKWGDLIFVSGQIPLNPYNPDQPLGTLVEQVTQTLANIQAILVASGSDKSKVLKSTIFMTNLSDWPEINRLYGEFFGSHKPARSAVPVTSLPKNCLVEIEVIACLD